MVDQLLADLASQQYGLFSRAQALDFGASPSLIMRRVDADRWAVLAPGVYSLPGIAPSWRRSLMGACLEAGPDAVVSDLAAAALHRVQSFTAAPVVVMLPHGDHQHLRLGSLRQSTDLSAHHGSVADGIPVTTVPRTVVDLAARVRPGRLRYAVEDVLAARTCTLDELVKCHGELSRRGKRGMATLGFILEGLGPGPVHPTSELERLLLKVLRDGGLPEPVREYAAPWDRNAPGRVDFAYPWVRAIMEGDSRRWHTRERDFEADRRRDRLAQLAGWDVFRFTWHELKNDPDEVVSTMDQVLRKPSK